MEVLNNNTLLSESASILPHMQSVIDFIRDIYGQDSIPLHMPVFTGTENQYLLECIDSNLVSSVGERVNAFEDKVAAFTGSRFAVATDNGTAALHSGLQLNDY